MSHLLFLQVWPAKILKAVKFQGPHFERKLPSGRRPVFFGVLPQNRPLRKRPFQPNKNSKRTHFQFTTSIPAFQPPASKVPESLQAVSQLAAATHPTKFKILHQTQNPEDHLPAPLRSSPEAEQQRLATS